MRRAETIIATTHVDAHFERMSPRSLDTFVEDIRSSYIPLWVEHDPRIPPRGRISDAYVKTLADGEIAVVGVIEEFDRHEISPFDNSRQMKIADTTEDLILEFDRSYQDVRSAALIQDIADLLGSKPQPHVKKALIPISVLTLAGKFEIGGIAAGFTKKVGEVIYE